MTSDDNKILVELAYPYHDKFRTSKKDIFCCQNMEAHKKIIEIELKHYETFGCLSMNKNYKSIANCHDINKAITKCCSKMANDDMDINNYEPDINGH